MYGEEEAYSVLYRKKIEVAYSLTKESHVLVFFYFTYSNISCFIQILIIY